MFQNYQGRTADEVWRSALNDFKGDSLLWQPGRGGQTREVLHATLSVADPRQRWVGSRWPILNIAFALAEIVWIVQGRRDLKFLQHWNSQYGSFTGNTPTLYGAYGHRLREVLGFDQLERAFEALSANPNSRQVVLQIWNARSDLPHEDGSPQSGDIPCNVMSLLKVREGRLEWTQVIRSNDMFLGVPHNVVQFTALQEIMAGWLGLEVGTYNQLSDSLHVYERDQQKLDKSPVDPIPESVDDLRLDRATSSSVFLELEAKVEALVGAGAPSDVATVLPWPGAPEAYLNILAVLVAESARRRGWTDESYEAISCCTNPAYLALWERWNARMAEKNT